MRVIIAGLCVEFIHILAAENEALRCLGTCESALYAPAPVFETCTVGISAEAVLIETVNEIGPFVVIVLGKTGSDCAGLYAVGTAKSLELIAAHEALAHRLYSHTNVKTALPVSFALCIGRAVEHSLVAVRDHIVSGLFLALILV